MNNKNKIFPSHIYTRKHNNSVNDDTMRQINTIAPQKAIDFGVGDGFYGKLLKYLLPTCYTVGIEMEKSYIEKFGLMEIYDELIVCNLEDFIDEIIDDNDYDLAIFGDVLEHLVEDSAKEVIKKAASLFSYTIINSPLGFQEQAHEITSEIHKCGIEQHMFDDYVILEWHIYCNNTMFNCLLKGK